jgi:predicted O-linked N-acetylglucosamine transferase (SPINDLY family)
MIDESKSLAQRQAVAAREPLNAPGRFEYRLALAEASQRCGDLAQALFHFEMAATLADADERAIRGIAGVKEAVGLGAVAPPRSSPESRAAALRRVEEAARCEAAGHVMPAIELLRQAARLCPDAAPIHYRLGCLLQDIGQAEIALAHYEFAALIQPDLFGAVHNAGKLAAAFGLVDRARPHLAAAQRLRPAEGIALRTLLLTDAIHDSVQSIEAGRQRFAQGLDRLLEAPLRIEDPLNKTDLPTFYLAYHGVCNRSLHSKLAHAFAACVPDLAYEARHCRETRRRPGRIRIGFISQFLRNHSIGKVARGLIGALDRERFEVHVLNIPPMIADDTSRWIQAHSDHWLILPDALAPACAQIAALELDILFYQDIGMEPFSYLLAFARLAKVQCVSFGHPDTTGLPTMDYYVSNDAYEPPGATEHYSERLFELHDLPTLAYYQRPAVPAAMPGRAELGLPVRERLYVCAQTPFKLHPDFDDVMRGILERDGNGRILLVAGRCERWSAQLERRFRRTMPDVADRVQFLPRQAYARYLQLVAAADAMLDTPHFNGMTTSIEAFSVGTPVITMPAALQRGRVTAAMYRKMEIADAVAGSAEEYAALAVAIASDPERRRSLGERIAERNHVLFGDRRAVAEFERFFLTAHGQATGAVA